MKLFAIADLHMDGGAGKPMDVFGANWAGHVGRIFGSWKSMVGPDDAVLIPGDISWAMHWAEAQPDLAELASLPGKKVLLRGNHDYWWGSLTRMRTQLPPDMLLVQNDCADIGPCIIAGSRGWLTPESPDFSADDRKIYERELIRLELSLSQARRRAELCGKPIIAMMHFPPLMRSGSSTGFSDLFEKYGVLRVLYGHLHGSLSWEAGWRGEKNGVLYELCSADSLGFEPMLVTEFEEDAPVTSEDEANRAPVV